MERREKAVSVPSQVAEIVRPGKAKDTPESGLGLTNLHASRGDRTGPQAIPNRLIWTNDNLVPDCR